MRFGDLVTIIQLQLNSKALGDIPVSQHFEILMNPIPQNPHFCRPKMSPETIPLLDH